MSYANDQTIGPHFKTGGTVKSLVGALKKIDAPGFAPASLIQVGTGLLQRTYGHLSTLEVVVKKCMAELTLPHPDYCIAVLMNERFYQGDPQGYIFYGESGLTREQY
mgnify:CR=1 FL=1